MAKKTLLEVVQSMLNSIGSDNVNSINDTEEAALIANMARDFYAELATTNDWPHLRKVMQLSSGGGSSYPSHLIIPDAVQEIFEFRYDTRELVGDAIKYTEITYKYPDEFLDIIMARNADDTAVDTITDYGGTPFLIYNERPPAYWTAFDDNHIVCDAYDSDLESSLQSSKTQARVRVEPSFTLDDDFTLDFPGKDMPYFMAELKALVWNDVANTPNPKAEQAATRAGRNAALHRNRAKGGIRFPTNYGRK